MAAGDLDEAVRTAAKAMGEPLRLHIVISANDTKEQLLAKVTDGALDDVSIKSNPEMLIAGAMKGCKTLSDLGAELAGPIRSKAE